MACGSNVRLFLLRALQVMPSRFNWQRECFHSVFRTTEWKHPGKASLSPSRCLASSSQLTLLLGRAFHLLSRPSRCLRGPFPARSLGLPILPFSETGDLEVFLLLQVRLHTESKIGSFVLQSNPRISRRCQKHGAQGAGRGWGAGAVSVSGSQRARRCPSAPRDQPCLMLVTSA